MSTIFDFIEAAIFTKNSELLQSTDDEKEFSPYMVNRWLSMYNSEMANVVNETTNRYGSVFDSKKELFNFYVTILPQVRPKKINYIKKTVKEAKELENIELIAITKNISQREVREYSNLVDLLVLKTNI